MFKVSKSDLLRSKIMLTKLSSTSLKLLVILILGLSFSGCSLKYKLNQSDDPTAEYDTRKMKKVLLKIIDDREDKEFTKGINGLKAIDIKISNVDDPLVWLRDSLQNEFSKRGVNIDVSTSEEVGKGAVLLTVSDYDIISSRYTGFHPYVGIHSFQGELDNRKISPVIIAYFLYGKTPAWSMNEVQEPCFDMPQAIIIKEIVAKINRHVLHYSSTDQTVENITKQLQKKKEAKDPKAYLHVLDLGAANNQKAMENLVQLADDEDLLIRACALSAIGMLGPEKKMDFLKERFKKYKDIDKIMALKSIGDIGNAEALRFIEEAKNDPLYENEVGLQIFIDKYLANSI